MRPSSLPMLAQCPQFAGEQSEYTDSGTDRHKAFAAGLRGDMSLLEFLDDEEQDKVRWAIEYVQVHAPTTLTIEEKRSVKIGAETLIGTPDVVSGKSIFDLKWRRRDYLAQMAAYGLSIGDSPFPNPAINVSVHILFAESKYAEVHELSGSDMLAIVTPILFPKDKTAKVCDYCSWCSKRLTCKTLTDGVHQVAVGYSEGDDAQLVDHWHPSQMETAEEIAAGLTIARRVVKPWLDSMEYHAKEAATTKGMKLPNYELKERKGKEYVESPAKAWELLKGVMPFDEFVQACALRINSSKTNEDQIGLIKLLQRHLFLTQSQAKKELQSRLQGILARSKPTLSLKATKETTEEKESEE